MTYTETQRERIERIRISMTLHLCSPGGVLFGGMVKPGQVTLSQQEIGWTPSANATAGVQIAAVQ